MSVEVVTEQSLATLLAERWEQVSRKLADLAEAIPAENFQKTPVAGLRTCGAVVRHVAFWNQYVVDSLGDRAVNDTENELPSSEYPDKQSVLDELMRTSRDAASALRNHSGALNQKTTELMMAFVEHTSEHYGQLAVYARLLGIVPPASRA
jgi:uncharacterized damage-inducible protein DinB